MGRRMEAGGCPGCRLAAGGEGGGSRGGELDGAGFYHRPGEMAMEKARKTRGARYPCDDPRAPREDYSANSADSACDSTGGGCASPEPPPISADSVPSACGSSARLGVPRRAARSARKGALERAEGQLLRVGGIGAEPEREGVEARAAFGDEAAGGLFRRGGVSGSHGTGGAARPSFYPNTGTGERVGKGKDGRPFPVSVGAFHFCQKVLAGARGNG